MPGYTVKITYTSTKDLLNAKKEDIGVVTPCPVPGLAHKTVPSDAYIYASEGSTKPIYNKEAFLTIDTAGKSTTTDTYKTAALMTSSQRRWPRSEANSMFNIITAYATPQVPVYRAWQTFKLAVDSGSYEFTVDTFAESQFYKETGTALKNYGIEVTATAVTESKS